MIIKLLLFVLCLQLYEEFDKTPYTLVETQDQLQELSQHLCTVTEFAVDLEVCNPCDEGCVTQWLGCRS